MLFRIFISNKTSAHRAAEKHWKIFYSLASWQWISSQFAIFLRTDWIHKSLKTTASILWLRLSTKRLFFLWLSERKLRDTSFTPRDDLIFAIWQIFSEILEMRLKNLFRNWIMRLYWVMKQGDEYSTKSRKKNWSIFVVQTILTSVIPFPAPCALQ
jgi:hypothetical protein